MKGKIWTRDELIYALSLYFQIPFGRLNSSHTEIIKAATILSRTPSSVSMKLCNFARFDPAHKARQIKGLEHGSKMDGVIWNEFYNNWESLTDASLKVMRQFPIVDKQIDLLKSKEDAVSKRKTETQAEIKARLGQDFFRGLVLSNFDYKCAITGIAIPGLLNASHIIPWSQDETKRLNPSNGLCLNAIHDRAFDKGYITLDEGLRLIVGEDIRKEAIRNPVLKRFFNNFEGKRIANPERFELDREALEWHREYFSNKL
ncbi:HNH endonuclease [bacterium]|nr:HNH endonuclease [bacterium]